MRIGGIVSRAPAIPRATGRSNGGPQMVEVSRDGKRIYFTNSLYGAIDPQFYPDGVKGWMVKVDAKDGGGIELDKEFFIEWPDGYRPHQVRLQGGDASVGLVLLPVSLGEAPRALGLRARARRPPRAARSLLRRGALSAGGRRRNSTTAAAFSKRTPP